MSVCLYVRNTTTFERIDVESSSSVCGDIFTGYGSSFIGVARGCSGCTCTPQGSEKIFSGVIYRENV